MAGSTDEGSVLVLVEHLGIPIGCYSSLSSRQDFSELASVPIVNYGPIKALWYIISQSCGALGPKR